MTSKIELYELILTPLQTCALPGMPDGAQLTQALPGCLCSDLFVRGFSHKPLDLCSGIIAQDDVQYRLLKQLKNARYIHDSVRLLSANQLLAQLQDGSLTLKDGYIGHNPEVTRSVSPVRLPEGDRLFGIQLHSGCFFRFFVMTTTPDFPQTITVNGCQMTLHQALPVQPGVRERCVLQHDLPVAKNRQVAPDSASRFKLSYNAARDCIVVCAGSVISQTDYLGAGILI